MKTKTTYSKKDTAVTLACLAFLLANLAAVGAGGRRRAKEAMCLSNLRQWGAAYQMYADDSNGTLCTYEVFDLYPYYKDIKMLICPSATKRGTRHSRGGKFEAWFTPDVKFPDDVRRDVLGSYATNAHVGGTGNSDTGPQTDWLTPSVKGANSAPVLLDAAGGAVPLPMDDPPEYDGQIYLSSPMNIDEIRNFCINRHNGGVNALFLDFSARKVGLKELWVLKWNRTWPCHKGICYDLPQWPPWMKNFKDYERPSN